MSSVADTVLLGTTPWVLASSIGHASNSEKLVPILLEQDSSRRVLSSADVFAPVWILCEPWAYGKLIYSRLVGALVSKNTEFRPGSDRAGH